MPLSLHVLDREDNRSFPVTGEDIRGTYLVPVRASPLNEAEPLDVIQHQRRRPILPHF
jgi:hypothetical protein